MGTGEARRAFASKTGLSTDHPFSLRADGNSSPARLVPERRLLAPQVSAGTVAWLLLSGIQVSAGGFQVARFGCVPSAGSTKDATKSAAVYAVKDSAAGTPFAVAG